MTILLKACLYCRGDCLWDADEREWVCLQAGHRFKVCIKCGSFTDWDPLLGPEPLCQACWDNHVEIDIDHKEKAAAARRAYRERNPEKVAAARPKVLV